ncbi:MAG: carbohydrate ABC transporter permease [Clostridiales bacterium]|uniref:carbohydrate ABC transporter permease n=1 Tax=Oscillospiraceae TaxID=216572 RepID=UPI0009A6D20D|nr:MULTISPECIES: carbohydrate ABC transporter permease [Oscillospiraceae]PWM36842.1 MAG: carbohydrate ABC transporter permease [Clostridiales bacterium]RGB66729.1 carbohydrate ABC transporter permease [Harryflintia acetispora]
MKVKQFLVKLLRFVLLAIFLFATIFPFYWLILTSFKSRQEINSPEIHFWPAEPTVQNYITAFKQTRFDVFIGNSAYVTIISSLLVLIIAILGGYALSRYQFRFKNLIMGIFLVSQMVPLVIAIIPMFILYSKVGLIDNLLSLIISYTVSNVPFCMITMSSFFKRIPVSLEEAAQIDGCNRFQSVLRVVLPVMLPGIVAVFVFAFTGCWNELFYSIMMINSENLRTIPAGLMNFVQKYDIDWGQMTAAATVTLIPVTVMFFLVQKHIVAGLTAGAVKE